MLFSPSFSQPATGHAGKADVPNGNPGDAAGVDAYERLMEVARRTRRSNETLEQAFARIFSSPEYRDLIKMQKRSTTHGSEFYEQQERKDR
jgi:hypothetical protein